MSNDVIIEAWNTVLFEKFSRFKYLFIEGYASIIGRNIEEAVQFALEIGPAGEIIRLAEEEGERLKSEVIIALQEVIGKFARGDGSIWAPSSAWFITAYNPTTQATPNTSPP
jgi:hypothetical protein